MSEPVRRSQLLSASSVAAAAGGGAAATGVGGRVGRARFEWEFLRIETDCLGLDNLDLRSFDPCLATGPTYGLRRFEEDGISARRICYGGRLGRAETRWPRASRWGT